METDASLKARRETQDMSKMAQRLIAVINCNGQRFIGELLNLSSSEVSRKMMDESGFKISQIGEIFKALNIQVVSPNENKVVIDRDHYKALTKLSEERLNALNEVEHG